MRITLNVFELVDSMDCEELMDMEKAIHCQFRHFQTILKNFPINENEDAITYIKRVKNESPYLLYNIKKAFDYNKRRRTNG